MRTRNYLYSIFSLIFCFQIGHLAQAQDLYLEKEGKIDFLSEAALENIAATNTGISSVLKVSTKELAIKVPIKKFDFEKSLMQEHFNENYMESDKYPHATFKGKINEDIDFTKEGTYEASATGDLEVHGVTQKRTIEGTLTVKDGNIIMKTTFDIKLEDHKIKIPKVVFMNIAEVIAVTAELTHKPHNK